MKDKTTLRIILPYMPINWNEYINAERRNLYIANNIKQKEKNIVKLATIGKKYTGNYPISLTIYPHFKNKRSDLDNVKIKGAVDGLVSAGVIKNDNLNCIQELHFYPIFDSQDILEIEIKEL